MSDAKPILIMIPLGGLGTRFKEYSLPKPLIPCFGRPILFWLLSSIVHFIHPSTIANIVIPYHETLIPYDFESRVLHEYPHLPFHFIPVQNQKGCIQTVTEGLESLSQKYPALNDCPFLSLDGDTFYHVDIVQNWNTNHGLLYGFKDNGPIPIYSYLKLNHSNQIIGIQEKIRYELSETNGCHLANVGIYGFPSWKTVMNRGREIWNFNLNFNRNPVHHELYLSQLVSQMITSGTTFDYHPISPSDFTCVGTPTQLEIFLHSGLPIKSPLSMPKQRFCFDMDGTLVTFPMIENDYKSVRPISKRIQMVRHLHSLGHTIIIYSARRMKTHSGNVGKIMADIGLITIETLRDLDIPYDELYFGKPYAHYYIDDLAISTNGNLEQSLGFRVPSFNARSFHTVEQVSNGEIVRKKSKNGKLFGEIKAYQKLHEFPEISQHLPKLIHFDQEGQWMEIERIRGITLSQLYLDKLLTLPILYTVLDTLDKWHNVEKAESMDETIDIYANYGDKLKERWRHNQDIYPSNSLEIYDTLHQRLKEYEENKRGQKGLIHGDPVFSNILWNETPIFIDMRGLLDDKETVLGDVHYDWAKVLQSIIGYEAIMNGVAMDTSYQSNVLQWFTEWYESHYPKRMNDLKVLTASLFFTLVPLHTNESREHIIQYVEKARALLNL